MMKIKEGGQGKEIEGEVQPRKGSYPSLGVFICGAPTSSPHGKGVGR